MASKNGTTDIQKYWNEASSQKGADPPIKHSESLVIREAPDTIEVPSAQQPSVVKAHQGRQFQNPDQDMSNAETNATNDESPADQHALEQFDWDNFQARYDQAMVKACSTEEALLNEFRELTSVSSLRIF